MKMQIKNLMDYIYVTLAIKIILKRKRVDIMAKKIHILISRESFEELKEIRKEIDKDYNETYEEYLEREKKNPSYALFG